MGIMTPGATDSEKTTTQIPSSLNYSTTAAFNNNATNESSFDHMPSINTMAITRTTTTANNSGIILIAKKLYGCIITI